MQNARFQRGGHSTTKRFRTFWSGHLDSSASQSSTTPYHLLENEVELDEMSDPTMELKEPYTIAGEHPPAYSTSPNEDGAALRQSGLFGDSPQDLRDMQRLGKQQLFKRNFSFISTLGFISIYMATWEFVLVSLASGLTNGGFGGLFWTFIGTVACYSTIVASLAEMASMAPTSGGQYHWTSEFAPEKYQKFLSYASGWMSTLGWLASTASSVFVCSTLIQSLIEVPTPECK